MRCNFIEVTHRHGCSPVNLQHIFRAPFLKSDSHLPKKSYLLQRYPFKNDEKYFFFHLKSSFRSQDIYIFVSTFWHVEKKRLD